MLGLIGYRAVAVGSTPEEWVVALDHEWESVRYEARRRLVEAGEEAVEPVVNGIRTGTVTSRDRAFGVLADLYTAGDAPLQDHVESYLNEFELDDSARTRGLVQTCYVRVRDQRLRRMIDRCRAMGGFVRVDPGEFSGVVDPTPRPGLTVLLGPEWQGGPRGLELLKRMPKLDVVQILPGAPLSDAEVDAFREERPQIDVLRRGLGCVGIAGGPGESGFEVWSVDPRSGAARAGVEVRDSFVWIGDERVSSFESMFPPLRDLVPGDSVEVLAVRNGRWLEFEIVLGRNVTGGDCECDPLDGFVDVGIEP